MYKKFIFFNKFKKYYLKFSFLINEKSGSCRVLNLSKSISVSCDSIQRTILSSYQSLLEKNNER